MARDMVAEYARRTALSKLVKQARNAGVASEDIAAWVADAIANAEVALAAGGDAGAHVITDGARTAVTLTADVLEAVKRQMKRLGKEVGKLAPSAARGHAKRVELSTSILRKRASGASAKSIRTAATAMKARRVVKAVKRGKSLKSSLKSAGISKKEFRKTRESAAVVRLRSRGRYQFNPNYGSPLSIVTTNGRMLREHFLPPDWNTVMDWRYAAYDALAYNRPAALKKMTGETVRDARGRRYELETNPDAIKALLEAADQSEEEFFQSQGGGRAVRGRAANSNRRETRRAA